MKRYEFIVSIQKYPKGTVIEANPNSQKIQERLHRGIIKPVVPKLTTKVVEPEEYKDASSND